MIARRKAVIAVARKLAVLLRWLAEFEVSAARACKGCRRCNEPDDRLKRGDRPYPDSDPLGQGDC